MDKSEDQIRLAKIASEAIYASRRKNWADIMYDTDKGQQFLYKNKKFVRKKCRPDQLVKNLSRQSYRNRNGLLGSHPKSHIPGSNNYLQIQKLKKQSVSKSQILKNARMRQGALIQKSMLRLNKSVTVLQSMSRSIKSMGVSQQKPIIKQTQPIIKQAPKHEKCNSFAVSPYAKCNWDLEKAWTCGKRAIYYDKDDKFQNLTANWEDQWRKGLKIRKTADKKIDSFFKIYENNDEIGAEGIIIKTLQSDNKAPIINQQKRILKKLHRIIDVEKSPNYLNKSVLQLIPKMDYKYLPLEVQPGFVGNLTPDMETALERIKRDFAPRNLDPAIFDDYFFLRFLRARKFVVEKSTEMLNNYFKWRVEFGTDDIYGFAFPEVFEVKKCYPHGYHKTDKYGRSIYIERIGALDITRLFEVTTAERMWKYFVREYERLIHERMPAASAAAGVKIETSLCILDMEGVSMKMATSQVMNFVKQASAIAQDYYPEMLGRMLIINAPRLFTMVWGTVKGFLDEKTRNKISIFGGDYQNEMLSLVEPENIPDFWKGGLCKCAGGCLMANCGPWNPDNLPTDEYGGFKKRKVAGVEQQKPNLANLNFEEDDDNETDRMYDVSLAYQDIKDTDLDEVREILDHISLAFHKV